LAVGGGAIQPRHHVSRRQQTKLALANATELVTTGQATASGTWDDLTWTWRMPSPRRAHREKTYFRVFFEFVYTRRRNNHMSEIIASLPVHYGSHIGDIFFMPNLLVACSLFSGGEGVDNTVKASWSTITKTAIVSANPPELVTTGQPITSDIYLRWLDLDVVCLSATCTPLEGFGEVSIRFILPNICNSSNRNILILSIITYPTSDAKGREDAIVNGRVANL
jgi:hypothetical protein